MLHIAGRDGGPRTMNVRKDDRVSHTRFGPGVVIDVDWRYTIIEFDEAGVRKFVSTLVQLERCELPLPVKPAPARRRRRNLSSGESVIVQDGAGSDVSEPETTRPLRRDPRVPEESTKL
jgi:hypothetical protein